MSAFGNTDFSISSNTITPDEVTVEQTTPRTDSITAPVVDSQTGSTVAEDTFITGTPPQEIKTETTARDEGVDKKVTAVAKGLIEITIDPPASIIIDGTERTFSSSLGPLELSRGPHELICRRDGYQEYRETIRIKKGELSRRNITLQKIMGQLVLNTQKGARVFIDGEYRGTTPLHGPVKLPVGKHEVEIKKAGFKTWSSIVFVPENEELTLNIALVPM